MRPVGVGVAEAFRCVVGGRWARGAGAAAWGYLSRMPADMLASIFCGAHPENVDRWVWQVFIGGRFVKFSWEKRLKAAV